ncbi:hypothetical protein FB45DRAFT_945097 [Roridomyces roridus]|uniref:F-box domain-containing protein n=1 Tax=Roridomyces roridus TaxID=1738132 RepID=A0AAD7B2Y2_9AGAR|nr:hypothetical protein FB45DRAFT_945097 [Roridomyces roridus]
MSLPNEDAGCPLPSSMPQSQRHQHLVNSNEPPNAVEEVFFRDAALKTGARLTQLEDEIQVLQARHAQLQDEQRQNHSVLSPLRRFPPEILAEIFWWTVLPLDEMKGDVTDVETGPWVLTQVSSRWRGISLSTPSLWRNISVAYGGNPAEFGPDPQLEMVRTQLERAGSQNLRIQFYASESHSPAEQIEMFQFLASHSTRWELLDIQVTAALNPCLAQLRGCLPELQRLWIQWDTQDSEIGVDSLDCFESTPSLLDIGSDVHTRFIPILFPAHQLTAYRVEGPWEMHYRVLKMTHHIVEARLVVYVDDDSDPLWPEPSDGFIEMVYLRRLYVSDIKILDYLCAPVLGQLVLDPCEEPEAGPLAHLDPFLTRSSCAPWRLCITCAPSVEMTATILGKHPSITSFALLPSAPFGEDEDPDALATTVNEHITMFTVVKDADSPLVYPHLSEILFGSRSAMTIDYSLFLKMLESRRGAVDCALSASAFFTERGPLPDAAILAGMDVLRKGGLKLTVESGWKAAHAVDCWKCTTPWT